MDKTLTKSGVKDPGLNMTAYSALMAALITAGAYITIPVGEVPVVLQNFFVLLTGLLLPPAWAGLTLFVYFLAGAAGLPVFAGATGGLGHFLGPTGGFLFGYLPAVLVISSMVHFLPKNRITDILSMGAGTIVIYFFGLLWLKHLTGADLGVLGLSMVPYLAADAVKILAALPVAKALRPVMYQEI